MSAFGGKADMAPDELMTQRGHDQLRLAMIVTRSPSLSRVLLSRPIKSLQRNQRARSKALAFPQRTFKIG